MRHLNYRLNIEKMYRIMREFDACPKLNKKERTPAKLAKIISEVYRAQPETKHTLEGVIQAEEYTWMIGGQATYFFEDDKVAEGVMRGAHALHNPDALFDGPESFVIMLPDSLDFGGRPPGSGLLVYLDQHNHRDRNLFKPFYEAMGLPVPGVEMRGDMGNWTLCISYQQDTTTDVWYRVAMPSHGLVETMHCADHEGYVEYMDRTNRFNFFRNLSLDKKEQAYQFDLVRLVTGFLLYRRALPDRVRPGLPGGVSKAPITEFTKDRTNYSLRHPKGHSKPQDRAAHYRRWHFRQLMADRYYKGEHAHCEKGSRVVLVSDAYIGEAEVYTTT